jgi:hypothetical protein
MGHKAEGSATGKRYIHRRPEYLRSVMQGIEALYDALSETVRRPFKGRELIEQPRPEDLDWPTVLAKYLPSAVTALVTLSQVSESKGGLERETRLELATPTLARSCSTN